MLHPGCSLASAASNKGHQSLFILPIELSRHVCTATKELDFDVYEVFRDLTPRNETQLVINQFHSSRCIILLQVLALTGFRSLLWMTAGSSAGDAVAHTTARRQTPWSSHLSPKLPSAARGTGTIFNKPMNGTLPRAGS